MAGSLIQTRVYPLAAVIFHCKSPKRSAGTNKAPARSPQLLKKALGSYFPTHGCFQKWWYPTTMGFPTKNDHFGVFWGYPYFWKHLHWFCISLYFVCGCADYSTSPWRLTMTNRCRGIRNCHVLQPVLQPVFHRSK